MAYEFLVADRTGRVLAQLQPRIEGVGERLNDVGRLDFVLPATDATLTEDNLRFGNRVFVRFDNGLPDWGGVIDPPREWTGAAVRFTAYSGEYLLGLRMTDKGRYFSAATVGAIFQAIVTEANAVTATGVTVGNVWLGGSGHSPEYHYRSLLDIVQKSLVQRLSTADFHVAAAESGGQVTFTANFYERRGAELTGVGLLQGHNVTNVSLVEQGPIVNTWYVIGEGSTWGDARLVGTALDSESINEYGLRENAEVTNASLQTTLDANAAANLTRTKRPYNALSLAAVNAAPALWQDYGVGDAVKCELPSYGFGGGFDGMVRVIGREYRPAAGLCDLVLLENV